MVRGGQIRLWMAGTALVFLLVAFLRAPLLRPLNRLWMQLGVVLHSVMTPVTLGILFFGVITPVALVLRALGRDALRLRLDPAARSYWIEREPSKTGSMKEQY
jgi:hypothetical protein